MKRALAVVLCLLLLCGAALAESVRSQFDAEMQKIRTLEAKGDARTALRRLMYLYRHFEYSGGDTDVYNHGDGVFFAEVQKEQERVFPAWLKAVTAGQHDANLRFARERTAAVTGMPQLADRYPCHLQGAVSNTLKFCLVETEDQSNSFAGSSDQFVVINFVDASTGDVLYPYVCDAKLPPTGRFSQYSRTRAPVFSPDQRNFAFTFNGCLCVKPLGGRARVLDVAPGDWTLGDDRDVHWAAGGTGLYFTRPSERERGTPEVHFVDVDGSGGRAVTDGILRDVARDNRLLVARNGGIALCDDRGRQLQFWTRQEDARFSPDGTLISLYHGDPDHGCTVLVARGGEALHLVYRDPESASDTHAPWMNQGRMLVQKTTPRGTQLIVVSTDGRHAGVYTSDSAVLTDWATSTRIGTTGAVLDLKN